MKVEVRDAYPPFGLRFEFDSTRGAGYGFTISDVDTADFGLGRGDPNLDRMANLMPGRKRIGQFITIPRDDGLFPWAGWITRYTASPKGSEYQFVAADPGILLKYNRTSKQGTYTGSVGRVLVDVLSEIQQRSVLPISLERIQTAGPYIDFTTNARTALDAINQLARHANYEWWWDIEPKAGNVTMYLRFEARKGSDKRASVSWDEGLQLNIGQYTQDADGLYNEVMVVGGTDSYADRPAASVSVTGKSGDGASGTSMPAGPVVADGSPIFGGSEVITTRSINDQGALARAGLSYADTPEEFGEQLSGELLEDNTDMKRWEVGDIVLAQLTTTDLGAPVSLPVRVMGLQINPDTKEHGVELQIRQELL